MKKIFTALLSSALLLLTACSARGATNEQDIPKDTTSVSEKASEYDPFAKSENEEASGTMAGAYSHGVKWKENCDFILEYAPTVSFEYYIDNGGKNSDFGLLVFVNGFRQPYRTEEMPENKTLHIFSVDENTQTTQRIAFEPIVGELGDTVSVEIITMFHPEFIQKENSNYIFNHRISSLYPSTMAITQKTDLEEPTVCNDYDEESISDEMRQEFNKMNATGGYGGNSLDDMIRIQVLKNDIFYSPADRLATETDMSPFTVEDTATLCMYGRNSYHYRVSMYVNHELVKGAFDGADYIDMTVSSDTFSKKRIDLKNFNLSLDEYNHLYFIAVPIYNNENHGERMVLKSDTVTLVNRKKVTPKG